MSHLLYILAGWQGFSRTIPGFPPDKNRPQSVDQLKRAYVHDHITLEEFEEKIGEAIVYTDRIEELDNWQRL